MTRSDAVQIAITSARRVLGIDSGQPVHAWDVVRLRSGEPFFLVVFGEPENTSGVATVDPKTGEVLESARLPGHASHNVMRAEEAIKRAGFPANAETQLVWEPTPVSRSPFYPLWQIRSAGQTVWVDGVRGDVWDTLSPRETGRGGGEAVLSKKDG
jgi:hypothetical protein